jgi:hypothetical protein
MRQHRRTIIVAVLGAVVACGLVVTALFAFRARPVTVSPGAQPGGPLHRPLTSPFTGEPVTSRRPVLAVKSSAEGRPGRPTGRARMARTAPPSPPVPGSG